MRAKIIADIAIVSGVFSGYGWWASNMPFALPITAWEQVVAAILSLLFGAICFANAMGSVITWIHKGK